MPAGNNKYSLSDVIYVQLNINDVGIFISSVSSISWPVNKCSDVDVFPGVILVNLQS